jgi:hypothetical protein
MTTASTITPELLDQCVSRIRLSDQSQSRRAPRLRWD